MRVIRMGKHSNTVFLEKIGMVWLKANHCYIISPETKIWRNRLYPQGELDNHYIIDLLGVGTKWVPEEKRMANEHGYKSPTITILRGIEIKISLSDFKNGFIYGGCNYNYLMTPKGLITKDKVPKGIGLIEVDLETFTWRKWGMKYYFDGLKLITKPKYKEISDFQFDYATRETAYNCSNQMILWARDQLPKHVHLNGGSEDEVK